VSLIFIITI